MPRLPILALALSPILLTTGTPCIAEKKLHDTPAIAKKVAQATAAAKTRLLPRLAEKSLTFGAPIFLRTFKEERVLEVFLYDPAIKKFRLFHTYPIANWGSGQIGPKLQEGDGQAPEGFYYVPRRRMRPDSRYHLGFDLGFPNRYDRHLGRTGSFLLVHGRTASIGCYAMTDRGIEDIFTLADAALSHGQRFFRVHCFPFRMTPERMHAAKRQQSRWLTFWQNLKEGYDWFEAKKAPPAVTLDAASRSYAFSPDRLPHSPPSRNRDAD